MPATATQQAAPPTNSAAVLAWAEETMERAGLAGEEDELLKWQWSVSAVIGTAGTRFDAPGGPDSADDALTEVLADIFSGRGALMGVMPVSFDGEIVTFGGYYDPTLSVATFGGAS